jgi:large subunit ribosomal protein L6
VSRIGTSAVQVPNGVEVSVSGAAITVKGPKGTLTRDLPEGVAARADAAAKTVVVERADDQRDARSRHGLARTLVANMVRGVTEGYESRLEIVGVGYRAEAQGAGTLKLALGFSHPVVFRAPAGITFDVQEQTKVTVKGADKELVGQVAANIRSLRSPEPYKGKGVRYVDERVRRKAGKTGKK